MPAPIGPKSPPRASTLPAPKASTPKPPARASTLPPSSSAPAAAPAATSKPSATAIDPQPLKHPAMPEGGPKYSPLDLSTGETGLGVTGGDNKLKPPPAAKQNVLIDKPGNPLEKDVFGGTLKANTGSIQASTTHYSGEGVHHHSVQAEVQGPHASYEFQKDHVGRLGTTSAQVTAEVNTLKAQAQAGVSADTKSHAYTASLTAKAETGVGVTASLSHDVNEYVGGYLKGEAKASASAVAEGTASFDPKTGTAMLAGQVGAAAIAGAYGTAGGHVGRLHGSITAGAVAGAAAQASGKVGLENGFLTHSADVSAAVGVGTHVKSDVALDVRHHEKPGVASGLRMSQAVLGGVGSPASVPERPKSSVEKLLSKVTGQ